MLTTLESYDVTVRKTEIYTREYRVSAVNAEEAGEKVEDLALPAEPHPDDFVEVADRAVIEAKEGNPELSALIPQRARQEQAGKERGNAKLD